MSSHWLKLAILCACNLGAIACNNGQIAPRKDFPAWKPSKTVHLTAPSAPRADSVKIYVNTAPPAAGKCSAAEEKRWQMEIPEPSDAILGTWINDKGDRKMEIYKKEDGYFGKIISDASGKIRPGTDILLDLYYTNNAWEGRLFLPARNDEVSAILKLDGERLEITASKGMFREKRTWRKV